MRRKSALGLALAGAVLSFFVARPGSAGVIVNEAVPFSETFSVPCANGGAGEDVLLTGFLHVLVAAKQDGSGGLHTVVHFQPMGLAGTGLTTGDVYRATGMTGETVNGIDIPFEDTFVNNFRLIGPGKGNNLLVHELFHVTINTQGVVTVEFEKLSEDCK
jgi:hypothetical protein